jgi:drug/metabolite transporter (DMT)-like permease
MGEPRRFSYVLATSRVTSVGRWMGTAANRPWRIWAALATIYIVWGSTYLAIKVAVRTQPPLLSGGTRFLAAAVMLAAVLAASRRSLRTAPRELAAAALLGVVLLACGVGVVMVAETRIDSGVAAMIAGSVPLQVVVWRTLAREHVVQATRAAAAVGLVGLALIVVPGSSSGGSTAVGLALMLGASLSWSIGSFVSRRLQLPSDPFVATVYEMLGGGVALVVAGLAVGEHISSDAFAAPQLLAWLYLAVAGSLVGFTAYAWLLRRIPISQVVTHQYVNPLVAVTLGALLLGEQLTATTLAGAGIVIGAVFVTVRHEGRPPRSRSARKDAVEARPETA